MMCNRKEMTGMLINIKTRKMEMKFEKEKWIPVVLASVDKKKKDETIIIDEPSRHHAELEWKPYSCSLK